MPSRSSGLRSVASVTSTGLGGAVGESASAGVEPATVRPAAAVSPPINANKNVRLSIDALLCSPPSQTTVLHCRAAAIRYRRRDRLALVPTAFISDRRAPSRG